MKEQNSESDIPHSPPAPDTGETRVADAIQSPVNAKLADALVPGFQVEFDPDEAEAAGAFEEDALSEADALDSAADDPPPTQIPLIP